VLLAISSSFAKYVAVPNGKAWDKCVHGIPEGSIVKKELDGSYTYMTPTREFKTIEKCTFPMIMNEKSFVETSIDSVSNHHARQADGWQNAAYYNVSSPTTITSFTGTFNVPSKNPSSWDPTQGVIFVFPALCPNPATSIIQPVVQYGVSEAGGGAYWAMANWYVGGDGTVLYSNLTTVNNNDVIFGNMTALDTMGGWAISWSKIGSTSTSTLTVHDSIISTLPIAFCTLEVYNIMDCATNYPPHDSPVTFQKLALWFNKKSLTPSWALNFPNVYDDCASNFTITSPTNVVLHFQ